MDDKTKSIIDMAMEGMERMSLMFRTARDSGLYKIRKNWIVTDLELKTMLDKGHTDVQVTYGKLLIAEFVMQEQQRDPKAFKKEHEKKTVWEVYQETCSILSVFLKGEEKPVKDGDNVKE